MSALIGYIDTERTTISILRAYHDQQWKLENDLRRIKELSDDLATPHAMSATPVHGGGSRREEMLVDQIDRKAVLEKGYQQAKEYMSEFKPCWERLTEEEREILRLRFVECLDGNGIPHIMEKYHIGKTEAYNRSNRALRRLSILLLW